MKSAADYVMRTLYANGVRVVFGYPGQGNLRLLHAARDHGMRYVRTADERAAGFAAIGYVSATDRPAVVCVSKGPGITNALTSAMAAMSDGVPVLFISDNVSEELRREHCFQEFDPVCAFQAANAVKAATYCDSACQVPAALDGLFREAWTEPFGPVLLDLSQSALEGVVPSAGSLERPPTAINSVAPASVTQAATLLRRSSRPVLIVGTGARRQYQFVRHFTEAYDIPVVHTMGGTGVISTEHPNYAGLLRHNGTRSASYTVSHADLVIALGTGLDERATGNPGTFAARATKVHVDLSGDTLKRRRALTDLQVSGSVGAVLSALQATLASTPLTFSGWRDSVAAYRRSDRPHIRYHGVLSAADIIETLAPALRTSVVVKDSGSHKYWVTKLSPCTEPSRSIASCHFGAMGFALAAAIGASIARPEDQVIAVCGDGGALMSFLDLLTAVREACANLKIIVFNNAGLGSTRDYERRFGRRDVTGFDEHIDFAKIAASMGVMGERIADRSQLSRLATQVGSGGLRLFDCLIDADEPMSPAVSYRDSIDMLWRDHPAADDIPRAV